MFAAMKFPFKVVLARDKVYRRAQTFYMEVYSVKALQNMLNSL